MKNSIMQADVQCYFCGRKTMLQRHHVMSGTANRKISDRYGLWIWCCHDCHTGKYGVQYNAKKAKLLKKEAQITFEEMYSEELWMKEFRKNYKYEEDEDEQDSAEG